MSENEGVLKVRGFIYKIFDVQTFKNDFTKRSFILETRSTGRDGKEYKNLTEFQTTKSFTSILDNIGIGSEVVVTFALDGREWETPEKTIKYITSLRCWHIDIVNNTNQDVSEPMMTTNSTIKGAYEPADDNDDLPF